MEIQGESHHVLGKQSPGRCTSHNSMNIHLQLTTEVLHVPTKAPGCLAYSFILNDICPLRVTTDITLYDIIMQILNIWLKHILQLHLNIFLTIKRHLSALGLNLPQSWSMARHHPTPTVSWVCRKCPVRFCFFHEQKPLPTAEDGEWGAVSQPSVWARKPNWPRGGRERVTAVHSIPTGTN